MSDCDYKSVADTKRTPDINERVFIFGDPTRHGQYAGFMNVTTSFRVAFFPPIEPSGEFVYLPSEVYAFADNPGATSKPLFIMDETSSIPDPGPTVVADGTGTWDKLNDTLGHMLYGLPITITDSADIQKYADKVAADLDRRCTVLWVPQCAAAQLLGQWKMDALPADAELTDVCYDWARQCFGLRYRSAQFAPVPAGSECPTFRMPEDGDPAKFQQSFDAREWARAFVAMVAEKPGIAADEGAMIAWFANALMRGHDEAVRRRGGPMARAVIGVDPAAPGGEYTALQKVENKYNGILFPEGWERVRNGVIEVGDRALGEGGKWVDLPDRYAGAGVAMFCCVIRKVRESAPVQ